MANERVFKRKDGYQVRIDQDVLKPTLPAYDKYIMLANGWSNIDPDTSEGPALWWVARDNLANKLYGCPMYATKKVTAYETKRVTPVTKSGSFGYPFNAVISIEYDVKTRNKDKFDEWKVTLDNLAEEISMRGKMCVYTRDNMQAFGAKCSTHESVKVFMKAHEQGTASLSEEELAQAARAYNFSIRGGLDPNQAFNKKHFISHTTSHWGGRSDLYSKLNVYNVKSVRKDFNIEDKLVDMGWVEIT